MSPEEKEAYCADNHVQTCLPKVVQAGLKALNMQCFFTAGADEVIRDMRWWGVPVLPRA